MQLIRNHWWLLCIGLLGASSALAEERVFDKKFAVTPGGTLTVETDTGAVAVSGGDTNEVIVHAVLHGGRSPVERFEIKADSTSDGVAVHGRRSPEGWLDLSWIFGGGLNLRYTIQVPRDYHVQIRTSGGDLELRNINGKAYGRTSGGNVFVTAINGEVQIHTSGGNVRGAQLIGDVSVGTSGGDVKLEDVHGPVDAHTSGGNVRLSGIDGKLQAGTSGGDVNVELTGANRGVELRTSGGNVTITVPAQFAAALDARTSGGDVACELPLTTTGSIDRHHRALSGTINGGGNPLTLRTSGGDIQIRARS